MTLQEIYDRNPDWRNLPIVVYTGDGYDYCVGAYSDKDSVCDDEGNHIAADVLVITGN